MIVYVVLYYDSYDEIREIFETLAAAEAYVQRQDPEERNYYEIKKCQVKK